MNPSNWYPGLTTPQNKQMVQDEALSKLLGTIPQWQPNGQPWKIYLEQAKKAKLDLSIYASCGAVVKDQRVWNLVLERLDAQEMPPETAPRHPTPHQRQAVIAWISAVRDREARRNAGDPGRVLARRLSSAEYDYTIRDLTGVDIRPTREFPVDPAGS